MWLLEADTPLPRMKQDEEEMKERMEPDALRFVAQRASMGAGNYGSEDGGVAKEQQAAERRVAEIRAQTEEQLKSEREVSDSVRHAGPQKRDVSLLPSLMVVPVEEDGVISELSERSSSSEDSFDEACCASAFCREPGKGELSWEQVVQQERWLIKRKQARLRPGREQAPFSIAFSGGGVRAAAFQAGVLWRLAQAGKLQSVEHFVAVSGGAYVASAFASTLTAETPQPQDRSEVTSFYLRCAAKTICRMQRNVSYLVRDLKRGNLWQSAGEGSSLVPPILDLPLLIVIGLFSMLINPLTAFALYLFPFTEGVDLFEGFGMKAAFCVPDHEMAIEIFSVWGPSARSLTFLLICVLSGCVLWLLSAIKVCNVWRHPPGEAPRIAQLMLSMRAVVVRVSVIQLVIWVLITGAFLAELDSTPSRLDSCKDYIRRKTIFQDGLVYFNCTCRDLYDGLPWWASTYFDNYFTPSEQLVMNATVPGLAAWRTEIKSQSTELLKLRSVELLLKVNSLLHDILKRLTFALGSTSIGLMIVAAMLVALVLNPLIRGIFLRVLSLLGPVSALLVTGCVVQHRIFSVITRRSYIYGLVGPPSEWYMCFGISTFCCAILIVLFYHHLHSVSHTFYARSLQKAYFEGGKDQTWSDVKDNDYCPLFLFTGTVTDFRQPGDEIAITEISMSPLHTGSDKTGFVDTPSWRSLAKSAALAAAATDAFIIGMLDRARYRFWLEFLNLRMGDYILFERRPMKLVARTISRWRCISDKPFFLFGAVPIVLQTLALVAGLCSFILSYSIDFDMCLQARAYFLVWAVILGGSLILSFFAGYGMFEMFLHSPAIRHLHMALRYYHTAGKAPSLVYVTDGGVQDCTGVLQLLRRRSAQILLALAASDPDDELSVLRETMQLAVAQGYASFYDPLDPRRDPTFVLDDFKLNPEQKHFVLGLRYPPQTRGTEYGAKLTGRLVVVKNRLPPSLESLQPEPLLTEEEIFVRRGSMKPLSPRWKDSGLLQSDLAACCCDCCHVHMCNVGPTFPHVSNANQCLTPALFSALCRLGFRLSGEAVDMIATEPVMEEPWEAAIPRRYFMPDAV
ncbi:unnamed protein product [Symbiodinium natans]|uniref:PNPLA domain-containing protein n=1 Tax=Symbiodinium natans TaxID=878477 RepID=A0A812U072_9DINO|nr:unnamed protein product [Symbiodinium natans]